MTTSSKLVVVVVAVAVVVVVVVVVVVWTYVPYVMWAVFLFSMAAKAGLVSDP